jgi:Domain of unknown function (DUF4450)
MWTRRRFLGAATASAALTASPKSMLYGQEPRPRSQSDSPEITSGHYAPLFRENVARPLRYSPQDGAIAIRNGREFFNRPLYGPNIPFRVDGGDLPEFSLYLPGHGGNIRLGVASQQSARSKWFFEFESILASYDAGCLLYTLKDSLLGSSGAIHLQALTIGAALWLQVTPSEIPHELELVWAFGGVSGRRGKRNGDIGCEVEPVGAFFQMRPEECRGNVWTLLQGPATSRASAEVKSGKIRLGVDAPHGSVLKIGTAGQWSHGRDALWNSNTLELPLLLGRLPLGSRSEIIRITALDGVVLPGPQPGMSVPSQKTETSPSDLVDMFVQRRDQLKQIAARLSWTTPDRYLDGSAAALGIAADALWDEQQGCVMHGAVAWRQPLAGWRGPYVLDIVGDHDRMRRHLRHWIARQNVSSVDNGSSGVATSNGFAQIREAEGTPDLGSAQSRSEQLLHSAGDISHNHYDMNLVFFDALLRHLCWTGDIDFAREAWPALERHAAWERRLFRRDYGTPTEPLPLYEAYAAIWASDNLQYNGGGAAHSSSYNFYLNRCMAQLSERLKLSPEIGASYQDEADSIASAMRKLLWIDERGAFAESREWLGERKLAENPAVWTMYQALDSEVCNRKEAWQIALERLRSLRKIPVTGEGVPKDAGWQLACSDWQPYVWSLTLLVLAENLASALALFQAGLARDGYALLRGSLLDAGYRGLCPGNFPMSLQLDPHRQESQRDFGDPIGCASRAIVEGLWGLRPDLLNGRLRISPQLPSEWNEAKLQHPEVVVQYHFHEGAEVWNIRPSFAKETTLTLELVARATRLPKVKVNGRAHEVQFVDGAVGAPRVVLEATQPRPWNIELRWQGEAPVELPSEPLQCIVGRPITWPSGVQHHQIDDPQRCLAAGIPAAFGRYCVFALQEIEDTRYWLPIEISVAKPAVSVPPCERVSSATFEPVELGHVFSGSVKEILTRDYRRPRSPFCSLNLPDTLLGGWANFDVRATVDDSGLRAAGGQIELPGGLRFQTPADRFAPNCCFISQWAIDPKQVRIDLKGKARKLHLLLAGTTFPQATGSTHATITVAYQDGASPTVMALRSPKTWWPVEQDYPVDDYIFLLGEDQDPLPWRVDLSGGRPRQLTKESLRGKGAPIHGGAAFTIEVELDSSRELVGCTLHCDLYGIVLGLLGMTLQRS